jgi:hypothetical protein
MDRLLPNQKLDINNEIDSNNGLYKIVQQADGNLVLYRKQDGQPLWASNQWGKPVTVTVMQGDGNLVSYSAGGQPFWDSGTWNHPGASAVIQDDGNFVVYDPANHPLWASNTVQPALSPTIQSTDSRGYTYTENAPWWKQMCTAFPCFLALQWPGYATTIVEANFDGQPVVIQLWKGWCPKFLGLTNFPGGVGLEVGVYRRIPGKGRPTSLPFLPAPLAALILGNLANLTDNSLWWPFTERTWTIESSFINPITGQTVFTVPPQQTWWQTKWMNDASYSRYENDQRRWNWLPLWWPGNRQTPWPWDKYQIDFKVNGRSFARW